MPSRNIRLLLVATHPADSFDQAGGTLAHHVTRGDSVTAVIATTGVRSPPLAVGRPETGGRRRRRRGGAGAAGGRGEAGGGSQGLPHPRIRRPARPGIRRRRRARDAGQDRGHRGRDTRRQAGHPDLPSPLRDRGPEDARDDRPVHRFCVPNRRRVRARAPEGAQGPGDLLHEPSVVRWQQQPGVRRARTRPTCTSTSRT